MSDVKISGLPASTTPLDGTEVLPVVQGSTTKQVSVANLTTGRAVAADSITTGDLTISGTGKRITGDFNNGTYANRAAFQTSTTNAATYITLIPNGTQTVSGYEALNSASDIANCSRANFQILGTEASIRSARNGTGTYLPLTIHTNGSERARFFTSGGVSIGNTTDPGAGNLSVTGTVRTQGYTVATLPAAGVAGRRAYVTDATLPTYLGALTGGGAVVCPVFDNGTAWVSA
jgi:hypothetical protein